MAAACAAPFVIKLWDRVVTWSPAIAANANAQTAITVPTLSVVQKIFILWNNGASNGTIHLTVPGGVSAVNAALHSFSSLSAAQ